MLTYSHVRIWLAVLDFGYTYDLEIVLQFGLIQ